MLPYGGNGIYPDGILFEYDPVLDNYTKKLDFDYINGTGRYPDGGLTLLPSGKFYGMTSGNDGTIFQYDPQSSTYTKKFNFNTSDQNGYLPRKDLTQADNGKLYGFTYTGGIFGVTSFFSGYGVLFEFDPITLSYTKKIDFNGYLLAGSLTKSSDGKLYSTTSDGKIFQFDPITGNFLKFGSVERYCSSLLFVSNAIKGNQNITFTSLVSKSFGEAPFQLTATASSSLPITYSSSNLAVATISVSTVTMVGVGTTTITASQPGNTNYNAAVDVPQTFTVNKADQTITFATLPVKKFGDAAFALSATSSSPLAVNYISSNTAVATVFGSTVTIVGAGSTTITASQPGDGSYNVAPDVPQTLTVNKADQAITFATLPTKKFGDSAFTLSAISNSSLPASYASSNTAVATVSGSTVTIVGAGSTTITASQAGNGNYNAAPDVPQTLTVNKADQTITFATLPAKKFSDAAFALSTTSSSSLMVSYASSNTAVATVTGSTVTIVGAGSTTITASQPGDGSYNAATSVEQTLTINKADQIITFAALPFKVFNPNANTYLLSSADVSGGASGNAVSFISSDQNVATISGNIITIIGTGSSTITASQAGSGNYNAATDAKQTLIVTRADQTITLGTLPTKTLGDAAFTLGGNASSSLPVQYSTSSDKVTISGNTVTLFKAGSVTINANQLGNTNYNSATQVSQTFCINPAKPIITLNSTNPASLVLNSSSSNGNQWYLNGTLVINATAATLTASISGSYTVKVAIDNCISEVSAAQAVIITGDISKQDDAIMILFPNPAKDKLIIRLNGFDLGRSVSINVFDLTGKNMEQLTAKGGAELILDVSTYATGKYVLQATQGKQIERKQFIKE